MMPDIVLYREDNGSKIYRAAINANYRGKEINIISFPARKISLRLGRAKRPPRFFNLISVPGDVCFLTSALCYNYNQNLVTQAGL